MIQTTAAISRVSSGGGLFDKEGRLVGLTTLCLEGGQNLNFALPVEWIDEVKPGRKTVTGGRSQTEWWKRAIALEKSKDLHGLLQLFLKWAENEPTNDKAWYNLGVTYSDIKRYPDAMESFRKTVKINPEDSRAWYNLGVTYGNLKRYNDAIEALRQAVRINSEYAKARNLLGGLSAFTGNRTGALEAVQKLRTLDPEKPDLCAISNPTISRKLLCPLINQSRPNLRVQYERTSIVRWGCRELRFKGPNSTYRIQAHMAAELIDIRYPCQCLTTYTSPSEKLPSFLYPVSG